MRLASTFLDFLSLVLFLTIKCRIRMKFQPREQNLDFFLFEIYGKS